jgi:integrase
VEPADVLAALQPIEARGAIETAHRVRGYVSSIYRFGIASGRATRDPAADIRDALTTTPQTEHFAAVLDPDVLAQLLADIDSYAGRWWATSPALRLTPYLLVRPGTLRQMRWGDLDLDRAEWQTKSRKGHQLETVVPLPRQAVEILRGLLEWSGQGEYVFPGPRSATRPLSENAVNQALRGLGWGGDQVTAHGFRATARTLLDETLGWRVDWIETQLGHAVKDPNGRAYNRTKFIAERRAMMQAWADYLDALRGAGRAVDGAEFSPGSLL